MQLALLTLFDCTDFHFSGICNFQGSEPAAMFRSKFSVTKSVWVGYSAGSGAADSGAGLYFLLLPTTRVK